jgi:molybdopterin-guanine dinucleotide biosynthesis protein A
MALNSDIAYQLIAGIEAIESHEQLVLISAVDFPYIKKDRRESILRLLNKRANPVTIKTEESKEYSPIELTAIFNQ